MIDKHSEIRILIKGNVVNKNALIWFDFILTPILARGNAKYTTKKVTLRCPQFWSSLHSALHTPP